MAEGPERFNTSAALAERKYIQLQEIGLAQWLAIPFAVWLGMWFDIGDGIVVLIVVALAGIGLYCLEHGHSKRQAIARNQDKAVNKGGEP